jgi:hypothetical protein
MTKGASYCRISVGLRTLFVLTVASVQAEERADRVLTVPVPDGGSPVVAKTDRQGVIHLLFDTADGPRYVTSTDQCKSFDSAIPIVDSGSKRFGLEFHGVDMAVGKDGMVHVAMNTNAWKLKLPQREWAFFYARLELGVKTFSPVRNLNTHPSEGFSLAADDHGNVTACWLSDKLYANVSHDNGETFAPASEIDPAFDPCNCCTTSTNYGANGKLAILYREETNNERDMYLILWDQDRGEVTRTRISTTLWKVGACPMSCFTINPSRHGFVATWPTKDQIYFARLHGAGNRMPPGEIKTPGESGMHTGMLGLSAPDGSTLVAWKKNDQLYWQLYDPAGQPTKSLGSIHSLGSNVAGVVGKDGRFVLFH